MKGSRRDDMRKRFAIVIGVAAAGVMALGAQTGAAASEGVTEYNTGLKIIQGRTPLYYGFVHSGGGKKCERGRLVTLFRRLPGADRKLGDDRSRYGRGRGFWGMRVPEAKDGWRMYVTVPRKVGHGFVCRHERSPVLRVL
jgi:hypothetical protein